MIDRWVRQGGAYAQHWAFVPPRKELPSTDSSKPSEIIDAYIGAQLRQRGVDFAPQADAATLARRAALVLTGLPPNPEQVDQFLRDDRTDAYERFVDQLLDNPGYGEHQARYWLDSVRYGDTHGLHLDNRRGIYPYRDWVVYALNSNIPLDTFITWQLAGDLLPSPTLAQRVATGFVRMNPTTSEGGAIPAEFQAKNNFDRTESLGTVLLGMTLTCARCHTHKYDPITQTEYYRLLAFFNSTAEPAMDGNSYTYGPVIKAPASQTAWHTWQAVETARDELLREADARVAPLAAAVIAHAEASRGWHTTEWRSTPPVALAAELPSDDLWQDVEGLPGKVETPLPEQGQAIWVRCQLTVTLGQSLSVSSSGGSGSQLWLNGDVVAPAEANSPSWILTLEEGQHQLRWRLIGRDSPPPVEVRLLNRWETLAEKQAWSACSKQERLWMLTDSVGPLAALQLQTSARQTLQQVEEAEAQFTTSLVAEDLPEPRETRLLRRGEYNLPVGDPLEPGILSVMGTFPEGAPRNRLGLAQWLTSPQHPLVSRVLINRVWQRTFGEGLVRTPEDFGLQGEQPTHPALLDWLAVELQASGWDLKHMLRTMVTSRTFRQSSARRTDFEDPENRFWARGPRHRLDAEVLRDLALWASELLDPHMGGEGVKPYQPAGMWFALAHPGSNTKRYTRDKGQRLYRRSLYVYWKRTSPHPMMTLFDAPARESSCVRRSRTNTALQSLGLLNETQRVEMSRMLAERLLHQQDDDPERLNLLFRLLASRSPTEHEQTVCSNLLETMRRRYADQPEDARALLEQGDAPRDETLDPAEHAAWTQVAIIALASDAAILLY